MSNEQVYSYSNLLVGVMLFSALPSEIFLAYLFMRGNFWTEYEPIVVGSVLCILFSTLGESISKIKDIGKGIFFVSTVASTFNYMVFFSPFVGASIALYVSSVAIISIGFLMFAWDSLIRGWKYLGKRKLARKQIAIAVGSIFTAVLIISISSIYSTPIIYFFDTHPWAMTLIGIFVTLIGGIAIGRRTKKN